MARRVIATDKIAPPVGPFSAAVWNGERLFLSGQIALDPRTGKLIAGDVARQTEQILASARAVLEAAGKSLDDVVKTNIYLADMSDFAAMNTVYGKAFASPYPARTTVGVTALPMGASIEIEFVAE